MLCVVPAYKQKGGWQCEPSGLPDRVRKLFAPHIVEEFGAIEWPGTRTGGPQAGMVFVVEFTPAVKDLILRVEPDLTKWHPWKRPLPEDICLFRAGKSHPIFVSVIHEDLAWLVTHKRPQLRGVSEGPGESIWHGCTFVKGPYFCQRWEDRKRRIQVWSGGRWKWRSFRDPFADL